MKRILLAAMLMFTLAWTHTAFALATTEQVQSVVKAGNYAQAETMMSEVVSAKPNSAKAHYVYADILAHNAKFDVAQQQAMLAQQIDPSLGFTQPDKFKAFEQLLQREHAKAAPRTQVNPTGSPSGNGAGMAPGVTEPVQRASSGVPMWVWVVGILAVIVIAARMFSRANPVGMRSSMGAAGPGPGYAPGGYGGGYGPQGGPMMGPTGGGSGLLGTGLAAAGGVAAGMFAEKMLEGHRENNDRYRDDGGNGYVGGGGGGYDNSGSNDAAQQLESRDVDFGSGGDWGGDAGGGSIDTGGSSNDDGW